MATSEVPPFVPRVSLAQLPDEDRKRLEDEVKESVYGRLKEENNVTIAHELNKIRQEQDSKVREQTQTMMENFRKEMTPLTPDQIQKLLEQEYITFKLKIPWEKENGDTVEATTLEIVLRELPQAVEKKFYKITKDILVTKAQDLAALSFKLLEGDVASKITSLLEVFEPTFDILATACSMCLDHRGKLGITKEWVQNNLSSHRQWSIVQAQVEVNKLRDFFFSLFRSFQGQNQTTNQVGVPPLQP